MAVKQQEIGLLFGVLGGGAIDGKSGALIQSQLSALMTALNNKTNSQQRRIVLNLNISGTQKNFTQGIKQITEHLSGQKQFSIKLNVSDLIVKPAVEKARQEIQAMLKTLNLDPNALVSAASAKSAAAAATTSTSTAAAPEAQTFRDAGAAAEEAANKVAVYRTQLEALEQTRSAALGAVTAAEQAGGAEAEQAATEQLRAKYEDLSAKVEEFKAKKADAFHSAADIQAEGAAIEQNSAAIQQEAAALRQQRASTDASTSSTEKDTKALSARNNLLRQAYTLIAKLTKAQQDWTAASSGKTAAKYSSIGTSLNALNEATQKFVAGSIDADKFKSTIGAVNAQFAATSSAIKDAGENTKTFGQRVGSLAGKFGTWVSVTQVIMSVVRGIRRMISTTIELDDAMTQLRIVTRTTEEAYRSYMDTITETATRVGSSISDLIDSTTTFARLGYSLDESGKLAEYTAMLQNVGDIDVSAAQDAITAIVKAFDIPIDEIESVMDKLIITGNNFPISVSQIAEGMNNASSALAAAGNTFDQSVALLTAANTTIQNAAKSSTGIRTIAARLRNTKTELDELGETMTEATYGDLVAALTKYNVELTDVNGQFRSTYDIIADIAGIWDKLSSMEQAGLATAISGTRQQAVFFSLVEQFQEASGAMEEMNNSAGTLESSYATYMESVTAHINQFKAAFESLSQTTVSTDFLNGAVDLGTKLLGILESVVKIVNAVGGLNTVLWTTAGILAVIHADQLYGSLSKISGTLTKIRGTIQKVIVAFSEFLPILFATSHEQEMFVANSDHSTSALGLLGQAFENAGLKASAAQIAIGGLVSVLGVALIVYNSYRRAQEEAEQRAKEAVENYQQAASSIDQYISRVQELKASLDSGTLSQQEAYDARAELLSIQDEVKEAYGSEAAAIDLVNASADQATASLRGLTAELANKSLISEAGQINKAISQMEKQRDVFVGLGPMDENDPVVKRIQEVVERYESAGAALERSTNADGTAGGWNLTIHADARSAEETIASMTEDFLALKQELEGEGLDLSGTFLGLDNVGSIFSDGMQQLDKVIDKYGELYDQQIQWKIATNDGYAAEMEKITAAEKALQDAVQAEDDAAIKNAVDAIGGLTLGYIDDASVANYMAELLKRLQAEANKQAIQVKLNPEMSDDDARRLQGKIRGALNQLAGDDGVVTAIEIKNAGIDYDSRSLEPFDAESRFLTAGEATTQATDQARAYEMLSDAAGEYGLTVEELIPILAQYGYITGEVTEQAKEQKNTLSGLGDTVSALKGSYNTLTTAMEEMAGGGGLSSDTAVTLIKELTDAGEDYLDYLYEENGVVKLNTAAYQKFLEERQKLAGTDGLTGAIFNQAEAEAGAAAIDSAAAAFKTATDRAQELRTTLDGLSDANKLDWETYQKLCELLPGAAAGITDVKSAQAALNAEILRQNDAVEDAYTRYVLSCIDSINSNDERCRAVFEANRGLIDDLSRCYGVDYANWQKLANGKWAVDKSLVGSLSELWQKYSSMTDAEIQTSIDRLESMDIGDVRLNAYTQRALNDLQAALALRKSMQQNWGELQNVTFSGAGGGSSGRTSSGSKTGSSSAAAKEVEEYTVEVDKFRKAQENLRRAEEDAARLENGIETAESYEEKIAKSKELTAAYQAEQAALHSLNDARDAEIQKGVQHLRDLGFQVEYNADTNELWIENLEHINELTASSKGEYDSLRGATNAFRKETEDLIGSITDLNDANRENSSTWLELRQSIIEATVAQYEYSNQAHENAVGKAQQGMENAAGDRNLAELKRYAAGAVAEYRAMQQNVHEEAEYYRSLGYSETSDEISNLSDLWWEYADNINDVKQQILDYLIEIVDVAHESVDEIQSVSETLHNAADEFAANDGFISVDTYQAILELGPQYMQMLKDENGLWQINEERINAVIAARTRQLAVENAFAYVERIKQATQEGAIESLDQLIFANNGAASSTWGLVYAELELMHTMGDLTDAQYAAALHNIDAIRDLAENAAAHVGDMPNALQNTIEELEEMQSNIGDLIDYVMDMLKDRVERQIDLLEEMKDKYADIVDLKKESLDAAREEEDYDKNIAKKVKELAKLQERLNALALDDSREAQAERASLAEEMAELQEELADTQAERAADAQKESLDKMKEDYDAEKDAEIEKLKESISSTQKLYDWA